MYAFPALNWALSNICLYLMLTGLVMPLMTTDGTGGSQTGMVRTIPGMGGAGTWMTEGGFNAIGMDETDTFSRVSYQRRHMVIVNSGGRVTVQPIENTAWSGIERPGENIITQSHFPKTTVERKEYITYEYILPANKPSP